MVTLHELHADPNALAPHYSRFRVGERILLSGHSHQAWPDIAERGLLACFADAADAVDGKWAAAEERAEDVRAGYRRLLVDPGGAIGLGPNTHDLIVKLLSTLDLTARPRVVTTEGEFHSLRRQLDRMAEDGLELVRVALDPLATLAERVAAEVDHRTALVAVSAVLFQPLPFPIHELGLAEAWVTGGGYKYLQLGEGNAFLRIPPHAHDVRPAVTGWFAEFVDLTAGHEPHVVTYGPPDSRFASGTYDPASHYRAAEVFAFFAEQGLEPAFLRTSYQHQLAVLAEAFDALDLPPDVIARDDLPLGDLAAFHSLRAPAAAAIQQALVGRGVFTDSRADRLRVGPAPYVSDRQLVDGIGIIGEVAMDLGGRP